MTEPKDTSTKKAELVARMKETEMRLKALEKKMLGIKDQADQIISDVHKKSTGEKLDQVRKQLGLDK